MFVLAMLMISRIRFPKAKRRDSNFINVFQVLAISGIYYCGITRSYPEYLLGMGLFLMIAGIIAGRITRHS
jgi:phosphatidylserine synthase